jgi:hypothetical protein
VSVLEAGPDVGRSARPRIRKVLLEIAVVFAFVVFYKAVRLLGGHDRGEAFRHAHDVVDLEHRLHLPHEQSLQHLVRHSDWVTQFCNVFYAQVSFPATLGGLLWLLLLRPRAYPWAKWSFIVASTVALPLMIFYPLAPPRMLPELGFIDTGALFGQSAYGNPTADRISNQFAAMPSLHCGWALIIATVFFASGRTRWRWLWWLHPAMTFLVVAATSNHYWLDGVVGWALCGGALVVVQRVLTRLPAAPSAASAAPPSRPSPPTAPAR